MKDRDEDTLESLGDDDQWRRWRDEWSIRADTTYLNHGSFGPTPRPVRECQLAWQQRMTSQPMDFFVRQFEPAWLESRTHLARFVCTAPESLAFVENSTAGMNVVAATVRLQAGDEVLLTDHEYGAVQRIWRRACQTAGAAEPVIAQLPRQFESADQVVDAIFRAATERTRLLVVSHITSPTAIILPVRKICDEARRRGIAACVDGPHAPAQVPVALDELACDFYTASLHKWISAPLGSGFLYVAPRWQERVRTPILSWGRVSPTKPVAWWEEFVWTGTRDPSAYLAAPAAIELLERVGLAKFRARTHCLARYARQRLVELIGLRPHVPDCNEWYGSMASVPLPPGDARALQNALWQKHGIEVP
ncbi:MAG TPA: aminotransferase class V-fold PLP-dependent enzyme, partial [Lacipirellulaceae bacterium]|nr:aminotransferase class V-fold PLP-dependent enzyme [Lacipirellulaceae bacterium]